MPSERNPVISCGGLSPLSSFATKFLLLSLLLDIGGGFGIKYFAFGFVVFVAILKVGIGRMYKEFAHEAALVSFFVCTGMVSLVRGLPPVDIASDLSFSVFFILVFVLKDIGPDKLEKWFLDASLTSAILVLATFSLIYTNPNLSELFNQWATSLRLGYIGLRPGFKAFPNVYFRWSIWLILGFSITLWHKKHLMSIILATAIMLTASTAMITSLGIVILVFFLVEHGSSRYSGWFSLFIMAAPLVLVALLFPWGLWEEILLKFSPDSGSTSTKLGHLVGLIDAVNSAWYIPIVGQGPGTYFFSPGIGLDVRLVEVSHFNLLRQYGLLGASFLFVYIGMTIVRLFRLRRGGRAWATGLFVMFIVAGTNPLLLSPIYFVPFLMGRVFEIESRKKRWTINVE